MHCMFDGKQLTITATYALTACLDIRLEWKRDMKRLDWDRNKLVIYLGILGLGLG